MTGAIHQDPALRDRAPVFADRREAGGALARLVAASGVELDSPLLLAIPAGGVPVALAMAEHLGWPLDLAAVSKITLPWNPEAGYGAVAFDGRVHLNDVLVARLPLTERMIAEGIEATRRKVADRAARLRPGRPPLAEVLAGRTPVLVDDGLASGFTMEAAVAAVRAAGADRIAVAVPTGSADTVARLAARVDHLFCPNVRSGYPFAVADAYRRWHDVAEAELARLLAAWEPAPPEAGDPDA